MAGSLNKVTLVGNIGKDPEIRFSQSGDKIVNLTLATSERWKDKTTGEMKEKTEWHRVVVFNPHLADIIEKYVHKGSKLYIEGALQTRKWTDQSDQERYTTEIVLQRYRGELLLLDKGDASNNNAESLGGYGGGSSAAIAAAPKAAKEVELDDDMPF